MRLSVILLSIVLVGGSVLAVGGFSPDLLILIALIGGVIIVLDWANKPHQTKREELREKPTSANVMVEPHKVSNVTRQGAFVGGIVGAIHGVVQAVHFSLFILPLIIPLVVTIINSDPRYADLRDTFPKVMSSATPMVFGISILLALFGALMGCVLGVLFVSLREHIPGRTTLRKSLVFSLILVVITLLLSLRNFLAPTHYFLPSAMDATLRTVAFRLQLEMYATTLIEFPILGCLFGYLFERKMKPEVGL